MRRFARSSSEILQESVTRAKFRQSVETDVLHHLALLKFISQETGNQFSSILVECKDWIRGRGELFEHSEQAHVMRSKIADLQADRKNVIRQVGETLCRIWREVEEGTILETRRALFGDDFPEAYPLLQNRFLFVEGGNDDQFFLEHYVLLGNFVNDPDRFETFDALLLDFVRDYVLAGDSAEELSQGPQCSRTPARTGAITALGTGARGGRAGGGIVPRGGRRPFVPVAFQAQGCCRRGCARRVE